MAGATGYFVDADIGGSLPNRDTIIASGDDTF